VRGLLLGLLEEGDPDGEPEVVVVPRTRRSGSLLWLLPELIAG